MLRPVRSPPGGRSIDAAPDKGKKTAPCLRPGAIYVKIAPFPLFKATALKSVRQDRGAGTASVNGRGGIRGRPLERAACRNDAADARRPLVTRRTSASLPPICGGGAVADRSVAFRQSGQQTGSRKGSPGHPQQARRALRPPRGAPCPHPCERIAFRRLLPTCPTPPPARTPDCAATSRRATSR